MVKAVYVNVVWLTARAQLSAISVLMRQLIMLIHQQLNYVFSSVKCASYSLLNDSFLLIQRSLVV